MARLRSLGGRLLLLAVALPAVQPLLGGALPWSADGLLHLHRLAQLDRALRHGILFPRWAPDMGLGFGFPLFNYYAPLSYYLAEPLHLAGLNFQHALLAAFVLATITAAAGAYLCGRDLFGPPAGLVSALAFIYAPYNLYDVIHRGALAEAWGLAWLPFIFWALKRLARRGRRADLALSALLYAALLLTHNILALVSTPLFILYAAFLWKLHGRGGRRALLLGGALLLGLGLTAFFWLPALLEQGYVQIHQLYAPADLDFHNNFTSLPQLLSPPRPVDPALINPTIPLSFGWPQLTLGLLALVTLRRFSSRETRFHLLLLALGILALTTMMLPLSLTVWDNLPLLRFVQFPWRLLGPAGLFLALLAGAGAARLPGPDWLRLPLVLGCIIVFAFTWLFPHFYPPQPAPTPLTLIAFEQETGALGTTSAGDYLPIWVEQLPPPQSLVSAYEKAAPDFIIPRLDPASLPPSAQVLAARYGLTTADLTLDAPAAFSATFNWYFFPGWQARLDGHPLPLHPTGEHGLIAADLPAGRHHLTVRFGDTPLRRWATGLSILTLAILFSITNHQFPNPKSSNPKSQISTLPVVLVALALFTIKAVYLDHNDTFFRRTLFDGQTVAGMQFPRQVNFDDRLMLMGYDLSSANVRADELLDLTLYWRTLRPLDTDYSIAVHLVDDRGRLYGQRDSQHPAGYPTSRWQMGTYGQDRHRLSIWTGTPPGEYTIQLGVYDVATGHSLDVRNESGVPTGTTCDLASVRVARPTRPPDPAALEIARPLRADLGGGLILLGFDPSPDECNAGDRLPLTLYWQAASDPAADYAARLALLAANGAQRAEESATPGRADYPTSNWRAGDVVRDGHSFLVPAATPSGDYTLRLDLLDAGGAPLTPPVALLHVTVNAPQRSFALPTAQHPLSATLGGQAALLGYDLSAAEIAPGQPLTLTLYWRAEVTTETGYISFAHLLDAAERIHAQSDHVPAAGARPTTGWLPGEIVRDTFVLTVSPDAPPGRYVLEIGMYDPTSGERLRFPGLGDRLLLPTQIQVK